MSKINLGQISDPVKDELVIFNQRFRSAIESRVNIVDLMAKYILKQKGKRLRPLLVLLSAKVAGNIGDRTYRGAIMAEILHNATLVHDDVVDNSFKRRGLLSLNARWGNREAVLMGDYLLAKCLLIAVEKEFYDFSKIMADCVRRMSESELLQTSKTKVLDIDEKTYFAIISDKTASLLASCCEIGALSVSENCESAQALKSYGENLGISFQIKDDILDFTGSSKIIGKPAGADLKEKKITLPLISAINEAEASKGKKIKEMIKNVQADGNFDYIMDFVKESCGIDYAEKVARDYATKAVQSLNIFPDSPAKDSLILLTDYVVERQK